MGIKDKYVTADEREALYKEVWADPVVKVAKRYGLSDNGLRKHCKRLGIPLPYLGYWSKLRAGKKVKKTPLPKVTGEVKNYVRNYVIKYKANIEELTEEELKNDKELSLLSEETEKLLKETCSKIKVKGQLRNAHDSITEHREEMKYRKNRDRELEKSIFNINYYNKVKSNYREDKTVLPIDVSKSNINRAYRILDTLIKTIENLEGYVNIGQFSNKASFVVLHSSIDFELKEVNKKRKLKGKEQKETFLLLSLQAQSGSYYYGLSYKKTMDYKDKTDLPLENQIGKIIYDIFISANKICAIDELNRRERDRKLEEEKRKRNLEEIRNNEFIELELLNQASSDWDKAQRIRRFADSIESKITDIKDEEKKKKY